MGKNSRLLNTTTCVVSDPIVPGSRLVQPRELNSEITLLKEQMDDPASLWELTIGHSFGVFYKPCMTTCAVCEICPERRPSSCPIGHRAYYPIKYLKNFDIFQRYLYAISNSNILLRYIYKHF